MRVAVLFALAAGCTSQQVTSALKAPSAEAAGAVVTSFFAAVQAGDTAAAAAALCRADPQRIEALGKLTSAQVDRVEPAWVGAEPYFRVDVTVGRPPRLPGEKGHDEQRSLAVRARQGCIERTGGVPLEGAAPPEAGEITL